MTHAPQLGDWISVTELVEGVSFNLRLPVDQQMLFYSENVLDGQTPIKERASQRPAGPARTKRSETETSFQILAKPGS